MLDMAASRRRLSPGSRCRERRRPSTARRRTVGARSARAALRRLRGVRGRHAGGAHRGIRPVAARRRARQSARVARAGRRRGATSTRCGRMSRAAAASRSPSTSSRRRRPVPAVDDTLTLFLLCCHPALTRSAQVALTLRAVGRAHDRRDRPRPARARGDRRAAHLAGEGAHPRQRRGLPDAAGRRARRPPRRAPQRALPHLHRGPHGQLGRVRSPASTSRRRRSASTRQLHAAEPDASGETTGLLALMLLTEARRVARTDAAGALVPLDEQDRDRWDRAMIDEGVALVTEVLDRAPIGPYQLQAAIAAVHDEAPSTETTDWIEILGLYDLLARLAPGPMVTLGRIVALAMVEGPAAGPRRARPRRVRATTAPGRRSPITTARGRCGPTCSSGRAPRMPRRSPSPRRPAARSTGPSSATSPRGPRRSRSIRGSSQLAAQRSSTSSAHLDVVALGDALGRAHGLLHGQHVAALLRVGEHRRRPGRAADRDADAHRRRSRAACAATSRMSSDASSGRVTKNQPPWALHSQSGAVKRNRMLGCYRRPPTRGRRLGRAARAQWHRGQRQRVVACERHRGVLIGRPWRQRAGSCPRR